MAGPATLFQSGDHASRPAAGAGCVLYWCTDHNLFYRSNGSAWSTWADIDAILGGVTSSTPESFVGAVPPWISTASVAFTANRAYLLKFTPRADITVDTVNFRVNTQAGNLDFGIFNAALSSRLGSTGSFACPAAGNQSRALTGSVALVAGVDYYFAFATDSTTVRIAAINMSSVPVGTGWATMMREEAAFPLPSSIAAADGTEDSQVVPVFFFTP